MSCSCNSALYLHSTSIDKLSTLKILILLSLPLSMVSSPSILRTMIGFACVIRGSTFSPNILQVMSRGVRTGARPIVHTNTRLFSKMSSNQTTLSDYNTKRRVPITLLSGFLGSGKTTGEIKGRRASRVGAYFYCPPTSTLTPFKNVPTTSI